VFGLDNDEEHPGLVALAADAGWLLAELMSILKLCLCFYFAFSATRICFGGIRAGVVASNGARSVSAVSASVEGSKWLEGRWVPDRLERRTAVGFRVAITGAAQPPGGYKGGKTQ